MTDDAVGSTTAPVAAEDPGRSFTAEWLRPLVMFLLTGLSTLAVGALMEGVPVEALLTRRVLAGWVFAAPLMAILLAHEMGHYVAGRLHGVDVSPPYFIPFPWPPLGTLGAVIRIRAPIERRRALLDVGAAGPLAGMVVALPVLVVGLATSPVGELPDEGVLMEGRGLLYLGVLYALKGAIPAGQDVYLNGTAFAGWAGLLITQINLIPVGQLDGGHVAYALFGERQDRYSRWVHATLPVLGVVVGLYFAALALQSGGDTEDVVSGLLAGANWVVWAGFLWLLNAMAGPKHPPTSDEPLGLGRRVVGWGTLLLFALLFMPAWMRAL
ncbi:MAG: site-2 protease family protein [Sandaracinaceae bacterium]